MSDLICRNTMMRCQTPGMCSPHGGCAPKDQDPLLIELARLRGEIEEMKKDKPK